MPITLVGMVKRGNMIDLKYAEAADDPQPFILTITPQYVAQQTAKPIIDADLPAFVLTHVSVLKETAEDCKARGLSSEVL
jgi:hypothetical protein